MVWTLLIEENIVFGQAFVCVTRPQIMIMVDQYSLQNNLQIKKGVMLK